MLRRSVAAAEFGIAEHGAPFQSRFVKTYARTRVVAAPLYQKTLAGLSCAGHCWGVAELVAYDTAEGVNQFAGPSTSLPTSG